MQLKATVKEIERGDEKSIRLYNKIKAKSNAAYLFNLKKEALSTSAAYSAPREQPPDAKIVKRWGQLIYAFLRFYNFSRIIW